MTNAIQKINYIQTIENMTEHLKRNQSDPLAVFGIVDPETQSFNNLNQSYLYFSELLESNTYSEVDFIREDLDKTYI